METAQRTAQRKVLTIGTQVRLSNIDLYGFCGRDLHPGREDEGFLGFVTGLVEVGLMDDDGYVREISLRPGDHLDGDGSYVIYEVKAPNGRTLQLVDHEIEVLK